jgi:hypothetical protein
MRPGVMLHKREEEVAPVPLTEYDDMIKTFPRDQTNQPFVLPFRHRDCTTVGRSGTPMAACLSRDERYIAKGIEGSPTIFHACGDNIFQALN